MNNGYKYEAIVFDFDGVLVESVDIKTRAFAALYEGYGSGVVEKVVAFHLNNLGVSRFDKFQYYHRELLGRELTGTEEAQLDKRFSAWVEDAVVRAAWVTGADELLKAIYGVLPLFIASGTPDGEIKRIVDKRKMRHYFISVHGAPRKKGQIIKEILHEHGFDPQRVLMVGDAPSDYDGAMEAGVCFVGRVPPGGKNPFAENIPVMVDLKAMERFISTDKP
jgi:HAD superfamily hydrolase (TIGR01549 family)